MFTSQCASGHTTSGRVVAWSCMDDADIAVLACDVPERIRPIPLYQVSLLRGQRFRASGFPRGYASGRWGYGELLDAVLVQGTLSRTRLLASHSARVEAGLPSILFGLQSFGEGLDLPGKHRLIPGHPLP